MIEEALCARISEVGLIPYPRVAPKKAVAPFIIYNRVTTTRVRDLYSPLGMAMAIFQVDIYDRSYDVAKARAEQVRVLLDGYREGEVLDCVLRDERDLSDVTSTPDLTRIQLEFRVTHDEPYRDNYPVPPPPPPASTADFSDADNSGLIATLF